MKFVSQNTFSRFCKKNEKTKNTNGNNILPVSFNPQKNWLKKLKKIENNHLFLFHRKTGNEKKNWNSKQIKSISSTKPRGHHYTLYPKSFLNLKLINQMFQKLQILVDLFISLFSLQADFVYFESKIHFFFRQILEFWTGRSILLNFSGNWVRIRSSPATVA